MSGGSGCECVFVYVGRGVSVCVSGVYLDAALLLSVSVSKSVHLSSSTHRLPRRVCSGLHRDVPRHVRNRGRHDRRGIRGAPRRTWRGQHGDSPDRAHCCESLL